MTNSILTVDDLHYTYPDGTQALSGLSLTIPKGKKIAIVGANGAGKSTLFLHFNGVHRPQKGKLAYEGKEFQYKKQFIDTLRKQIGIVFQDPDIQLFSASVQQDISFGMVNLGWQKERILEKLDWVMKLTLVEEFKNKPTYMLSHGQKKRVAIAGVLAMEPAIIALDEPTAGLDPNSRTQIMGLLDELNDQGATVIISSHEMDIVYSWADYVFVINQGKLLAEGVPEDVFALDEVLRTSGLEQPWVVATYLELLDRNMVAQQSKMPRNSKELFALFDYSMEYNKV